MNECSQIRYLLKQLAIFIKRKNRNDREKKRKKKNKNTGK